MERQKKRRLILVHGACHGAWCCYKVAALLKSNGHQVTALDMAASGIHPKQVHDLNSISEYFEPLMDFLRSLPTEEGACNPCGSQLWWDMHNCSHGNVPHQDCCCGICYPLELIMT